MIGRTIQHYHIVEALGRGGMGVVYKARDTHLDRFVAIKVLPPEKVADAERKRRFVQEAKAASALNHPNIVHIYDIAEADGIQFIAMEFVAGKTLGERIGRKGLRLNEVLKYAVQIADALAKAHSAGIIHRDLKPSNIMVTADGLVKVLDFGLAKLTEHISGEFGETATMRTDEKPDTAEGAIVGTVAYMSPEQAEGRPVDARSDLFAMGSLLYEIVTGERAFHGDSKLSTLSAILKEDPKPVSAMVADVPRDLEKIIARCLRKDPERRFQTMADLKVALEELKEESDSRKLVAAIQPQARRHVLAWSAASAVLGAAGLIALWLGRSRMPMPDAPLTAVPLTSYPGSQVAPTFSPDGNQVAFCWDGEKQDNVDIYVKLVGAGPPLRLTTNTAEDCQPAWSPDGRSIAFLRKLPESRAAVILVSPLGGAERKLAESSDFFSKPAWSPDGKWLVIADKSPPSEPDALFLLSMENGEKRRLTTPPGRLGGDGNPAFSRDSRTVAFVRSPSKMFEGSLYEGDIYMLSLSDGFKPVGEPKRLTFDNRYTSQPAWTTDGREVLFSAGSFMSENLWRMTVDGSSKPQRMASLGEGLKDPAISHQGRLAYMRESFDFNIWRMKVPDPHDRASPTGPKGTPFIASTRLEFSPRFSPDGKRIAFVSGRSSRAGNSEIWLCDSDGSNQVQVTSLGADAADPSWSPDGERVAFDSTAEGNMAGYVIRANGGKPWRVTTDAPDNWAPRWSRDGKWIYFASNRNGADQVWKMPAQGGTPVQVTRNGGITGFESSDAKFLYYAKGSGETSIWKVPVDGGDETQVIPSLFSDDDFAVVDHGIYFIPSPSAPSAPFSSIQFLNFGTGKINAIATTEKKAPFGLATSPDGRWILYTQVDQSATELMLVENFR